MPPTQDASTNAADAENAEMEGDANDGQPKQGEDATDGGER
jgi:hypothetical protein